MKVQATEVLDLSAFAGMSDVLHGTAEEAEAGAKADADWLVGQVVYVRDAHGQDGNDHTFNPPVRARVVHVEIDRWMNSAFFDPLVDFTFIDPVDPEAFWVEGGQQRGWWYSRTHSLEEEQ